MAATSATDGARGAPGYTRHAIASVVLALVAAHGSSAAPAASYFYIAADIPITFGDSFYPTNEIILNADGAYSIAAELPTDVAIGALARQEDGSWIFAPVTPVELGGTTFTPRDLVLLRAGTFSLYLDGASAGIPDHARIDALFLDPPSQDPILSFDVPLTVRDLTCSRSDLVRRNPAGEFTLYWDAQAAGVPPDANLVGADVDPTGTLALTFDIPVLLAGAFRLPGQLIAWSGAAFSTLYADPAWPPEAQLRDFAFVPSSFLPGEVQDPGLSVRRQPNGDLLLDWASSCSTADSDYEVYEGRLGAGPGGRFQFNHAAKACTTGGSTSTSLTPSSVSTYYLVVPRMTDREGSYGRTTAGAERPQGAPACAPQVFGCHQRP